MSEEIVRKPRNTGELLRWLIFEPDLLDEYSGSLKSRREQMQAMIMPVTWIALSCFLIYLLIIFIILGFGLPMRFPSQLKEAAAINWSVDFWGNLRLYFEFTFRGFLGGLAVGLLLGLIFGLVLDLTRGLGASLSLGFLFSLSFVLVISVAIGLVTILIIFLTFGLMVSLTRSWTLGLEGGVVTGLFFSLATGLISSATIDSTKWQIVVTFTFLITWLFFYYRLYFYIIYVLRNFFQKYSFEQNPHLWDGAILFPFFRIEKKFKKDAFENPEAGLPFRTFLLERRWRYQRRLAFQIELTSIAGQWKIQRNQASVIKKYSFLLEKDAIRKIQHDWLFFKTMGLQRLFESPTPDWYTQLETTRQHLSDFEQESNAHRRVRYFQAYMVELDRLYNIALRQPREWGEYFVKALALWQKSAAEKLRDLELEAVAEEPIAANIYRGGEKLKPEDSDLFFGRRDLRDSFKNRVVTAVQMPMFFIQGQRRVGKSSLIAFLPSFLDRGFAVVAYDMQEQPGISLQTLLHNLRERIFQTVLQEPAPELELPEDWLLAWQAFKTELDGITQNREGKIIIAIDEYEELHRILQTQPEQGGRLLAAMRSWSQSQNRVVFLFAGADFFSELKSPNWAEYFVQSERLLVDYLGHDDSLALILLAGLHYPPELLERMYYETQGHPCLLQKICREIVTIANKTGRESRAIVEADYDEALRRTLLTPDDGVVNIFWQQFCENRGLKATVRQIINGELPTDERAVLVLEDHGFIVPDKDAPAKWRMRVPLFEQWVRRYQVT